MTKNFISKITQPKFFPLVLLLFAILAYGLFIPFLGFYWDDWPMMWFANSQGPAGFPEAFSGDRPFLSIIYILTTAILPVHPLPWQILGIIVRWLLSVSVWYMILQIWPEKKQIASWTALLMQVYPGFLQQPISVVYGNGLVLLISYFMSHAWMVVAIRNKRRFWFFSILAVLSYAFCLFSTEYYLGLEGMRAVILFFLLSSENRTFWKNIFLTFKYWIPYLVVLLTFLIWRVLIFQFPSYQPQLINEISGSLWQAVKETLYRFFYDPFLTAWASWFKTFRFPDITDFSSSLQIMFWLVTISAFILAFIFLFFQTRNENPASRMKSTSDGQVFFLAGSTLIFAGLPYWVTRLPITDHFPFDRFSLAFFFGSSLLIAALINWLFRKQIQKTVILSLLICFAVGSHFINANTYRREWLSHNEFLHQLETRIPQLKKNTLIITHELPFDYYSDNSMSGAINTIFDPDNHSLDLNYFLVYSTVRSGGSIPEFSPNIPVFQKFRSASFDGNTSRSIVLFYSPPGCLRILDPVRDRTLPILPNEYGEFLSLSDQTLILSNPENPVKITQDYLQTENPINWCYYYEKAELARQTKDWDKVLDLFTTAFKSGFEAEESSEYITLLEAQLHTQAFIKAEETAANAIALDFHNHTYFCEILDLYQANKDIPLENKSAVIDIMTNLSCRTGN